VIDALRDNQTPDLPDPREQAVYDLAILAHEPGPGSDQTFDRAVASLGRDGLAEVLCLLGYYSAVAIAMKLHRVPIPPAR
jgi:4-carboxymuconolactone decarboxylase